MPHLAQRGDDQKQAQQNKHIRRRQEKPVKRRCQPAPHVIEHRPHTVLKRQCQKDERHNRQTRYQKDGIVHIKPERPDLCGEVILSDLIIGLDRIGGTIRAFDARLGIRSHENLP